MRRLLIVLLGVVTVAFAFDSIAVAQQNKPKKAKQTHDVGIDDADIGVVLDKNAEGATVTRHPDGMISSIVDESFLEVTVAVKNADGTISYQCVHGLPAASNHLKNTGRKESVAKKPVSQLEVK